MSPQGAPGRWTRLVTVAAVLLVAAVAAVVSYVHMASLAREAGEGWRSGLLPLSVDGLVVAASMVLLTRRRAGQPGGRLAWCALLGGVGASLLANMAAAEPSTTARVIAAWPALAFAIAIELLLQQRRTPTEVDEAPAPEPQSAPLDITPAQPEPPELELAPVVLPGPDRLPVSEDSRPPKAPAVSDSGSFSTVDFDRMVEIARPLVDDGAGRTAVTKALVQEFDRPVSPYWARKAVNAINNNGSMAEAAR